MAAGRVPRSLSETRSGFEVVLVAGMLAAAVLIGIGSFFAMSDRIAIGALLIVLVLVVLPWGRSLVVGGATLAVIAALTGNVLGPHVMGGQSLLKATADIVLWPYVVLSLFLGVFAHHHAQAGQGGRAAPRTLSFLISTVFYGLSLVLALQAGFAAWGLEAGQSIWAITRHAFAAETPIHTIVLSLWFGLVVRSLMRLQSDGLVSGWSERANASNADYVQIEAIARLLPMLGFLGTVIGLAAAVASISGQLATDSALGSVALATLFKNLAVKFETSLLGLMGTITMSVFLTMIEARQIWNSERNGDTPHT